MDHRVDILRVPPAPRFSKMYVLYAGTNTQIQVYADKELTVPIAQPITMDIYNIHFYCAENRRADIRIMSNIYDGGFITIRDQILINPETIANINYTMLDGTVCLDSNGNMYQEAIV